MLKTESGLLLLALCATTSSGLRAAEPVPIAHENRVPPEVLRQYCEYRLATLTEADRTRVGIPIVFNASALPLTTVDPELLREMRFIAGPDPGADADSSELARTAAEIEKAARHAVVEIPRNDEHCQWSAGTGVEVRVTPPFASPYGGQRGVLIRASIEVEITWYWVTLEYNVSGEPRVVKVAEFVRYFPQRR